MTVRDGVPWTSAAVAAALHAVLSLLVIAADPGSGGPSAPQPSGRASGKRSLLLGLRRWPAVVLVLYCAVTAAQIVTALPRTGLGWLAAAYLLLRHRVPRAPLLLTATLVAVVAVVAAVPGVLGDDPQETLATAALNLVLIGVQLAAAAGLGAGLRMREHQARQHAEERARRRREEALAGERQRITDELHGVVVVALHRLVAATAGLADRLGGPDRGDSALAEVQDRARGP